MEVASHESSPINDSWLRRILTLTSIKLLKHCRSRSSTVLFLSRKYCVKYSSFQHLSEAAALRFIAQQTSIPVPKVYCAFKHRGRTYIVMERIDGKMLSEGWLARSEASKTKILSQLKRMVDEMRSIPPPNHMGIANVDGGSLYDCRLPFTSQFGPFSTVQEFHRYLRSGIDAHSDHFPEVSELISQHESSRHSLCFTHGDLSSLNILVRGDEVVGIVDWETAGWYPSYWEYARAWHVHPHNELWRAEVDKFLEPMPTELAMEKLRLKHFGDV